MQNRDAKNIGWKAVSKIGVVAAGDPKARRHAAGLE